VNKTKNTRPIIAPKSKELNAEKKFLFDTGVGSKGVNAGDSSDTTELDFADAGSMKIAFDHTFRNCRQKP
jgi:hypothetical protein